MIILITGATHTGKTWLAQKLLYKYGYPYLSIDHLKMGLIRSSYCSLTPQSRTEELTEYLWPVVREIAKTNIENEQNLTVEGCYIPFDYAKDFEREYLEHIRFVCLIFSDSYIEKHFDDITQHSNIIEKRLDDSYCTKELLLRENKKNIEGCKRYNLDYILINEKYDVDFNIE